MSMSIGPGNNLNSIPKLKKPVDAPQPEAQKPPEKEAAGEAPQKGKSSTSTLYAGYYYKPDGTMVLYGPIGKTQDTTKTRWY